MIIRQSGTFAQRPSGQGWWTTRYRATDQNKTYMSKGGAWVDVTSTPLENNEVESFISAPLAQRPSPDSKLGYVFTDTDTGNQYEAFPGVWVAVPAASSGSGGLTPAQDIQAALNSAAAGSVVLLGPGIWDLGTGYIVIPNDVHLKGSGLGQTIIQSGLISTGTPFHGFCAPGNNSIISDLSLKAKVTGHCNPLSIRAGSAKTWTNVTYRNCHLYGGADVVYSAALALGNILFEDCLLEGPNDVIVFQSGGILTLLNCELRHTTIAGLEGLSATILYYGGGGSADFIKAYGCRLTMGGAPNGTNAIWAIESSGTGGAGVYVYDTVIDTNGLTNPANDIDFVVDDPGSMFLSNVRRADGRPLKPYSASNPPIFLSQPANYICTVAKLPASPFVGLMVGVSDGSGALAWGSTVVGGGATKCNVIWNGANWTVIGK